MAAIHRKLLGIVLVALLAYVIIGFIWQLASIQLRLSRNGKIAQQLVESLEAQFPGMHFSGVASYEREVIYINVLNHLNEAERQDVERMLRKQKVERQIAPQIWLQFETHDFDKTIILK